MLKQAVFLLAILLTNVGMVRAEESADSLEVRIATVDGQKHSGKWRTKTIYFRAPYGELQLNSNAIRKLILHAGDQEGEDTVELSDKTIVHGKLITSRFELDLDNGPQTFERADVKEITTSQKNTTLWAILLGLLTLTAMEIVLGIDNIIFLAIVAAKLPEEQQPRARRIGLIAALATRLALLASLSFLLSLTKPLFTIPDLPMFHALESREISLRDLVLLLGGMFLIWKSVHEMHEKVESAHAPVQKSPGKKATFGAVLIQIALLDIIFSLDSVITAVGMVNELWVMVVAMVIAMIVMMAFAGTISDFVTRHPTLKVLALAFLILIGVMLVAESLGQHIDKGYIYFAMAFALLVETVNLRIGRGHRAAVAEVTQPVA
jgi:predicted tellurium resistance membrane protein TerC